MKLAHGARSGFSMVEQLRLRVVDAAWVADVGRECRRSGLCVSVGVDPADERRPASIEP